MTSQEKVRNLACRKQRKALGNGKLLELGEGYSLRVYRSIIEIADQWVKVAPKKNVFFSIQYLRLIEDCPASNTSMRYCLIICENAIAGILVCQLGHFHLKQSLKDKSESRSIFSRLANRIKSSVANRIEFKSLVCGNLSLTGEYGFYFTKDLPYRKQFELVEKSLEAAREFIQLKENITISVTFMKDFYDDKTLHHSDINNSNFTEFCVQPNMILDIDPSWKSIDDYLDSLTSKYRVRAKRAFKKAKDVERKQLSWSEIRDYENQIFDLYSSITDKAEFNLVKLHPRYFTELKKNLPDKVKIFGYFHNDQLIAFNSIIWNGKSLEAHYLGYQKDANREFQIYLNMLFDIIQEGIATKMKRVIYARTALEIKSSVGATSREMYCYIKHRNSINNRFVPHLLKYLSPVEEWVPRQPFKEKAELKSLIDSP